MKIIGTIEKKGRKYFYVKNHKILLTEEWKTKNVGDKVKLDVMPITKYNAYMRRDILDYYQPLNDETERQLEIDRWFGYVKDTYKKKGYLYKRGIVELQELNAEKELEQIAEWKEEMKEKQIADIFERMQWEFDEGKGFISKSKIERLQELGAEKELAQIPDMQKRIDEVREERYREEIKKQNEKRRAKAEYEKKNNIYHLAIGKHKWYRLPKTSDGKEHYFSYFDITYTKEGAKTTENIFRLIDKKYMDCDGMSFGAMEEEWYDITAQDVDNSDNETVVKFKEERKRLRIRAEMSTKLYRIKDTITNFARKSGKRFPMGTEYSVIQKDKKVLWDTRDIYGSGEIVLYDDETLIHIFNCHTDGDYWAGNNIDEWGDGYSIPMSTEIQSAIDEYLKTKKELEEFKKSGA